MLLWMSLAIALSDSEDENSFLSDLIMLVFSPKRGWKPKKWCSYLGGTGYSFIWISLLCSSTHSLSCLVKICSLMTMGFLIVSLLSSLGFHYLILNFENSNFCYSEWLKAKSSYIQCHFLFQTLTLFFLK